MFFDTHCHLNNARLIKDSDHYVQAAQEKQVTHLVVVGYDVKSSLDAIALAERYPNVYAAVGIHPNECGVAKPGDIDIIESLLVHPKVVALGEIGLDYHWNRTEKELQYTYFETFIRLAHRHQKPIIIHNRNADFDTLQVLKKNQSFLTKGVMHCYSASKEMVKDFVDLHFYISFAGPLTFTNAKAPKEAAKVVPFDRLLIETDAPYLTPHPFRGQQNEPAYVRYVGEEMARLLNKSVEEVAHQTFQNACDLFGIQR